MCRVNKEPGEAFARGRAGDASSQGVQHAVWCQASDATGTGPAAEPGARWGPVVCGRRVRSCDAGGGRPQRCSEPGERRAPRARPSCGWLRARRRVARRRRAAPRLRPMGLWTATLTPCASCTLCARAGGARCGCWVSLAANGVSLAIAAARSKRGGWWRRRPAHAAARLPGCASDPSTAFVRPPPLASSPRAAAQRPRHATHVTRHASIPARQHLAACHHHSRPLANCAAAGTSSVAVIVYPFRQPAPAPSTSRSPRCPPVPVALSAVQASMLMFASPLAHRHPAIR